MSLLSAAMEPFVIVDKTTTSDGMGGVVTTWTDGAEIQAAIELTDNPEAYIAQQTSSYGVYRVTTMRSVVLKQADVIKRKSDGQIFLIVTDSKDNATPNSATLNMRVCRAREWSLVDL